MGKKKIIVSPDILSEYAPQEQLDDISLKFVLSDEYKTVNINLTHLMNNTLQRRKDLKTFKDFLINSPKSINTKRGYYQSFQKFISDVKDEFDSKVNLLNLIKKYGISSYQKVSKEEISAKTYASIRSEYRVIFTECFGVSNNDFLSVFPEHSKRTGSLDNATILDSKGNERAYSKEQFKDIGKIALNLSDFLENAILEKKRGQSQFVYQDIYELNMLFNKTSFEMLKNKYTFCLMMVFICLTGINLYPAIRMKRSDLIIDKERNIISFKVTCNRKRKQQLHNYPIKANQLKLFERILDNSKNISPENDIVFPFLEDSGNIKYFPELVKTFYRFFNIGFKGDYQHLKISAKKLRHSFGSQFEDIDLRAVALFNSTKTAAKNYSTGNGEENNKQLQNAMNIYTIALSNNEDIENVKNNIEKINVINIKDITTLKEENSQITSSGIFCLNSKNGKEPEKFARRIESLNLNNIDSINCANILACFNCKNSILVNDFENIYLLKSFYNYLNSSVYESDTSTLFSDKNAVKNALLSIQIVLQTKIDKKIIQKVDKYISKNGIHPLWDLNREFI